MLGGPGKASWKDQCIHCVLSGIRSYQSRDGPTAFQAIEQHMQRPMQENGAVTRLRMGKGILWAMVTHLDFIMRLLGSQWRISQESDMVILAV